MRDSFLDEVGHFRVDDTAHHGRDTKRGSNSEIVSLFVMI